MNLEKLYVDLIIAFAVITMAATWYFVDKFFTEQEARDGK